MLTRVMKRIKYLFLIFIIFTVISILFILNSTKILQWAADRYGPHYELGYKQISGTLLTGIEVEGLTYRGDQLLDSLKADWSPASLLLNKLNFTYLEANGVNVKNTRTVVETLLPMKNNNTPVIPFSVGVEELKVSLDPFTQGGVAFNDVSMDAKGVVYHDEAIDIEDLLLSIDTNVTNVKLSGGMQEKDIRVKELHILNVDTLAFQEVVKQMIEIRLQEKLVEKLEPEIKQYRAGKENWVPKSVLIDAAILKIKSAEHPQIRLDQGEINASALKIDIHRMIDEQPNTLQIGNLSMLFDTNLSRVSLDSRFEDETITVEKFSLQEIDTMALKKILGTIQNDRISFNKRLDTNSTITRIFPKFLHLKQIDTSVKSAKHGQIFIRKAEMNATDVMLDVAALTAQSGTFEAGFVSNVVSLSQHGVIKNDHLKSRGDITLHKALFETYGLPMEESTFSLAVTDLKVDKDQFVFGFDIEEGEISQAEKDLFSVDDLALKNRITYMFSDRELRVENEGNLSTSYVKDIVIENRLAMRDGVHSYKGKIVPGVFEGIEMNYTRPLENLEITYQGDAESIGVQMDSKGLMGRFVSDDFKKGDLRLSSKEEFALSTMFLLPHALRPSRAEIDMHMPLDFSRILPLHANAKITSDLVDMDVELNYDGEYNITTKAIVPEDSLLREFRDELNFDAITPIYTDITTQGKMVHGKVHSKGMNSKVTFNLENKYLEGYMVLGGAMFTYSGNLEKDISVEHYTSSVNHFLKQLSTIYGFDPPALDGDAKISMLFTDLKDMTFKLNSNTLSYKAENKKEHIFNDTMVSLDISDSHLLLKKYHTTFGEQRIFSERPSVITLKDGNIEIDSLWINDEMKVTGKYNLKSKKGELLALADVFNISHEKSNLKNRVDIRSNTKEGQTELKGTITLLEGNINHEMEVKKFSPDSDIINVQELKKREGTPFMKNLSTSIKVNTEEPLTYRTAHADVKADADLMIQKAYKEPIGALGTITILDGSSYTINNKKFLFMDSTINFIGNPYKPFLDVTAIYKTRHIEIMIQLVGNVHNPNVTFSSTPYMSRKRILSTILFDVQDNSADVSEENMLLMMGDRMSRSLFSNIGGETIKYVFSTIGINIDKLPFIGRSWDANQTKDGFFSFFSSDDEVVIPSRGIHFKGHEYISLKDLQKAMGVKTKSLLEFWKEDKPMIIDRLLPTLERSLQNFYISEGFYNAEFSIKTSQTDVVVSIDENEPVRVESITISSDHYISDLVTLKKGQVFRSKDFISIKKNISDQLMREGYCSYDLDSKAYVDTQSHEVDIHFKLKKGEVCTFGELTIKGLETIDDSVIISRVRAREGEPFSSRQIEETYDALYKLNVFDKISIGDDRKFYNVVPIEVAGTEVKRPWYFSAFVDYTSSFGFRLSTEVKRTNFLGNAKNISVDFTYSRFEKGLEMSYFVPALFKVSDYYFDFISKIGLSEFVYEGFTEEKTYIETLLGYNDEKWSINAGLALENIDISPRNSLYSQAVEAGEFTPVYPFFNFRYESRDSKIYPKYGYYIGGEMEYGLPYGEENAYLKYSVEGKALYTFSDITFSAIAKAGIVDQKDHDIAESKLFFAGGFDSNRAYRYREIGVITSPTSYTIEGGSTMANLSLEASYPLGNNLFAKIFTDNTMLTKEDYDFSGDIISSVGVGAEYRTMLGQIRMDVGMNIKDHSQYGINIYIGQSF